MIPRLFPASATSWDTEGTGRLTGALRCSVKEKLNGEYTLNMEYAVDGDLRTSIVAGSQIVAVPSYGRDPEPFDVKSIGVVASSGKVTVKAQHMSYRLNKYTVMPFNAASASLALSGLISNAAQTCPFTTYTDKSTAASYKQIVPASIRSRLGGVSGSILDVYGGEYEFTKFRVNLWNRRGSDRGVEIRYGKNLIDANQEKSIANTITGICPYWSKEVEGEIQTVTLTEKVLLASTAGNYPYPLTKSVDLTNEFEDKPTEAQLRTRAQRYLADNVTGIPDVNIKVSFETLYDTEEYASIASLERVELGDTVHVYFEDLGINATARVIETDWDVLRERYNSVTLGTAKSTITDKIVSTSQWLSELSNQVQTDLAGQYSELQAAINTATAAITGQLGGHLRFGLGADGKPNEMYIMDTDDVGTASKVWRYNLSGWGVSTTGINGHYTMAATLESGFIADFITAGTINANLVHIINLIVDHLQSYSSNNEVMLDSQSSYLDIRKNDNGAWRQRIGIYHSSSDSGAIRISSGLVDENGSPTSGQSSRRTFIASDNIIVGRDEDGAQQGTVWTKGTGTLLASTSLTAVDNEWSFDVSNMFAFVIEASFPGVGVKTITMSVGAISQYDKVYTIHAGSDYIGFKANKVNGLVTIKISHVGGGAYLTSARGII